MSGERKGVSDPLRISLGTLQEGIVVDRPNRFVANVRLDVERSFYPGVWAATATGALPAREA